MASFAGATDTVTSTNLLGELFLVGQNATPFLNMIGGLSGGGRQTSSFLFPISQEWSLDAGVQPAITETASLAAPTATGYARSQKYSTVQIFHKAVTVSYAKQSQVGAMAGINVEGSNVVRDEKSFQINANLKQIAKDVDMSFIQGAYQLATNAGVAAKTRGMLESITTNTVAAGATALTLAHINSMVKAMADNGSPFGNMVLFAGSANIQKITSLYKAEDAFMSNDRNVGGTSVKQVITDFCEMGIVWCPQMPVGSVMLCDMSAIKPVFLPVPGKGFLFYEELAKVGASEKGQIYGQIGLDHGVELFHGKITGLV